MRIFRFQFRPAGQLDPKEIFQIGKDVRQAKTLVEKELAEQFGKFELSEAAQVTDAQLPEDAQLFERLRRQREQLEPSTPAPTGPIFEFYLGPRSHRQFVYAEDVTAAREKITARAAALDDKPEVAPHVRAMSLEQFDDACRKRGSELYSFLSREDSEQLLHQLRGEYRQQVRARLREVLKLLDDESVAIPNELKMPPRPRLLREGEAYLQEGIEQPQDDLNTNRRNRRRQLATA